MAWSDLWALEMLLAAFAGGAFGAALGPLPAFIFTGFVVIAGEAANLVGKSFAAASESGAAGELAAVGITGSIAFGPVFSPAISFAGGAAAYVARKGYMDSGFDYHEAKNVAFAQGTKPDVLAVGGAFGIVGYWLTIASSTLGMPHRHGRGAVCGHPPTRLRLRPRRRHQRRHLQHEAARGRRPKNHRRRRDRRRWRER